MRSDESEFHLEEYKLIKTEIWSILQRTESLFKYALAVSATVFAWLAINTVGLSQDGTVCSKIDSVLVEWAWYIPAAVVLLSGIFGLVSVQRVSQMGEYLKKIENSYGNKMLGWEKHLDTLPKRASFITGIAWLLLLSGVIVGANLGVGYVKSDSVACVQGSTKT